MHGLRPYRSLRLKHCGLHERLQTEVQLRYAISTQPAMSIVVYYLHNSSPEGAEPAWQALCQSFSDAQMSEALKQCQLLRGDTRNAHVTISSELRAMVGPIGVAAVENGQTPDGHAYDWSKAGRAGASRRNAQQPPVQRKDMDN